MSASQFAEFDSGIASNSSDIEFGVLALHPTWPTSFSIMAFGCRSLYCCPGASQCRVKPGGLVLSFGATLFKCSIR